MLTAFEKLGTFHKVSGDTAYGWAFVSSINGVPYFDTGDGKHSDHIPEESIDEVAALFMEKSRAGLEMHTGERVADVLFSYPMTDVIMKGVEVTSPKTGLLIGWRPYDKSLLEKVASGERLGFSIGGAVEAWDIVDEAGNVIESVNLAEKSLRPLTVTFGKQHVEDIAKGMKRRVFRSWKLAEISLVDRPMQEGAVVGVVKSANGSVPYKKVRIIASVPVESLTPSIAPSSVSNKSQPTPAENKTMPMTEAEIEALKKQNARLGKLAELTDAQRAYMKSLPDSEQEAFLDKSAADRGSVMKSAVAYTAADGSVFYAHDDARLVKSVKDADEMRKNLVLETTLRKKAEFAKTATENMGSYPEDAAVHAAIIEAIETGIADETVKAKALTALKAGNAAIAKAAVPSGVNPQNRQAGGSTDELTKAETELKTAVEAYAKAKSITKYELAFA
jgi:hypothetical protein